MESDRKEYEEETVMAENYIFQEGDEGNVDEELLIELLDSIFEMEMVSEDVRIQVIEEKSKDLTSIIDQVYTEGDVGKFICLSCVSSSCKHIINMKVKRLDITHVSCKHTDKDELLDVCMACIIDESRKNKELMEQEKDLVQVWGTEEISDYYKYITEINLDYGLLN